MPSPSRPPSDAAPLTREEGDEVLRYWLSALRLEEALLVRPQARRAPEGTLVPKLEQPTPGQDYFKLPLDAPLAQWLGKQTELERGFDGELCGFFETWLDGQYRRSDDDGSCGNRLAAVGCGCAFRLAKIAHSRRPRGPCSSKVVRGRACTPWVSWSMARRPRPPGTCNAS